jgi:YVTN family beta-propeller protein
MAMKLSRVGLCLLASSLGAGQLWAAPAATYHVSATISVGAAPNGIAVNTATNRVYVANNAGDTVSVIDGRTYAVVATVPVGPGPAGVAVNPVTNRVYVAISSNAIDQGSVTVIDGSANAVIASIPVDLTPNFIAVNPVTNRAYVTNVFGNAETFDVGDGIVSVIDGTNTVIDRIHVGVNPSGVAVDTSANLIYVTMYGFAGGGPIQVIDGASDAIVNSIWPTAPAWSIEVNSVTHRAYAPLCGPFCGATGVDVIADNAVSDTVSIGNLPYGAAVNSATNTVFATASGDNNVVVIDGGSDAIRQTVAVGNLPQGIAANRATLSVFVSNSNDNTVSVLSVFAGTPGAANCHGATVSALATGSGEISKAAAALGLPSVSTLQDAITSYCGK